MIPKSDWRKIAQKSQLRPADEHVVQQLLREKEHFLERKSELETERAIHEKTTKQLKSAEQVATETGCGGNPSVREQHQAAIIEQHLSVARLYKEGSVMQHEGESLDDQERRHRKHIDAYTRRQCALTFIKQIAEPERYRAVNE